MGVRYSEEELDYIDGGLRAWEGEARPAWWFWCRDLLDEVRVLRSELASEREARDLWERNAKHWSGEVSSFRRQRDHERTSKEKAIQGLRQLLEQVEAERDEAVGASQVLFEQRFQDGRDSRDDEVASLKRELASAQAICWSALLVLSEGVPDDGSQAPDSPLPLQLRIVGTAALDSYVADATADLRKRVAELESDLDDVRAELLDEGRCLSALTSVLGEPLNEMTHEDPPEQWEAEARKAIEAALRERVAELRAAFSEVIGHDVDHEEPDVGLFAADDGELLGLAKVWTEKHAAAARAEGERAGEERAADIAEAARDFLVIIDKADLLNLSSGVQLGPTSWYAKASDARELLVDALRNFGERARPSTKEEDGHGQDAE